MYNLLKKIYFRVQYQLLARFAVLRKREVDALCNGHMVEANPLHGDKYLTDLLRHLFSESIFTSIVESGTFMGCTSNFFGKYFSGQVFTFEQDKKIYEKAKANIKYENVKAILADSGISLKKHIYEFGNFPFFYLDAHYKWAEGSPLPEELSSIGKNFSDALILVDDFKVPHIELFRHDRIFDFSKNPWSYSVEDLDLRYVRKFLPNVSEQSYFYPKKFDPLYGSSNGFLLIQIGKNRHVRNLLLSNEYLTSHLEQID